MIGVQPAPPVNREMTEGGWAGYTKTNASEKSVSWNYCVSHRTLSIDPSNKDLV